MKILLVNTSERTGGAAIACSRLQEALNRQGMEARMLVNNKQTSNPMVEGIEGRWHKLWNFLWERIVIWKANHFEKYHLFRVDIANTGTDITRLPVFKEADIIHLHWINQGMLSLKGLKHIFESGKPIVWTMHDLWPAMGICHHPGDCTKYQTECQCCPQLLYRGSKHDLSYKTFHKKQKLMQGHQINFVACSQWLKGMVEKSALMQGQAVTAIPNPIDTRLFKPIDQAEARQRCGLPTDKKLILFGSVKVTNKYKGADYLTRACRLLASQHPELQDELGIVTFGMQSESLQNRLPFEVFTQGYVSDTEKMIDIYNAVDLFVTPSLEENLPNMIMEAMACGTPCVGFRTGGIPEMIDHQQNGYIAEYKSADDLATGIYWILSHEHPEALSEQARAKVTAQYDEEVVVKQFIELYNQIKPSHA